MSPNYYFIPIFNNPFEIVIIIPFKHHPYFLNFLTLITR